MFVMGRYQNYTKQRRAAHKLWALHLLGGRCVVCGTTKDLEFDHVDPSKMCFRIGPSLGASKETLRKELIKCQLLCLKHHWDKTRKDRGLNDSRHGTVNRYNNKRCRCDRCTHAWTAYSVPRVRQYRQAKKEAESYGTIRN